MASFERYKPKILRPIFSCLLGVAVLVVLIYGTISSIRRDKVEATFVKTKGRVTLLENRDILRKKSRRTVSSYKEEVTSQRIEYYYIVDGRKYNKKTWHDLKPASDWKEGRIINKLDANKVFEIDVFYNPKDPEDSRLGHSANKKLPMWLFGFYLLPLFLIAFNLREIRNEMRKKGKVVCGMFLVDEEQFKKSDEVFQTFAERMANDFSRQTFEHSKDETDTV